MDDKVRRQGRLFRSRIGELATARAIVTLLGTVSYAAALPSTILIDKVGLTARRCLRWFLGRLHAIVKFRQAVHLYLRVVRLVQSNWRRRMLRVRASLRLTKTQWERCWGPRPPMHPYLVERACRPLVRSVHDRTKEVLGDAWGARALDNEAAPASHFPTRELVDDMAMRAHIAQTEHLVKERAPGWAVPDEFEDGTTLQSSPENSPAKSVRTLDALGDAAAFRAEGRRGRRAGVT